MLPTQLQFLTPPFAHRRLFRSSLAQHEITFDRSTDIVLCEEDASIQQNIFEFKQIGELESMEPETILDIVGVVTAVSPVSTITSKKSGQEVRSTSPLLT